MRFLSRFRRQHPVIVAETDGVGFEESLADLRHQMERLAGLVEQRRTRLETLEERLDTWQTNSKQKS